MGKGISIGRGDRGVSTISAVAPDRWPNMREDDRDSAPCRLCHSGRGVQDLAAWESHLRTAGVAAIGEIAVALVLAPENRCCCNVAKEAEAEAGWGVTVLVVIKGSRWWMCLMYLALGGTGEVV